MNDRQILVLAYQAEARAKPTERIYAGRWFTYAEFAVLLEENKVPVFVKTFLNNAEKLYRESDVFRSKMMSLAGVDVE